MQRSRIAAIIVSAAVTALAVPASARPVDHEIPNDVTVLAFIRPEGGRLRLLVRVPLEAMRDVEFPLRGPGYLVLDGIEPLLRDAARLWLADFIELREGGTRLIGGRIVAARVSLPSDRSFTDWDRAFDHVGGPPLPAATDLIGQQALLDVLLEYPIVADSSEFSVHVALAHLGLRTTTVLHFLPPGGADRVFEYTGDPGLIRLDPRWHQAFLRFVRFGFLHILDGIDHLLFVLCLVIPFRRLRPLVAIVTAFTIAHSITLIASATGLAPTALWFPPLIEMLIAFSILWLAFENILGLRRPRAARAGAAAEEPGAALERQVRHRWLIAFGFGLVHGFGFSFALRESLQFAGTHLATSLLAFNAGVELGQLLVIALAIPLLSLLFQRVVDERVGTILLSALIAHTAWHWLSDRFVTVRAFEFRWPAFDAALVAGTLRTLMLLLIVLGAAWLLRGWYARLLPAARSGGRTAGAGG
jgi:hypothetical protein